VPIDGAGDDLESRRQPTAASSVGVRVASKKNPSPAVDEQSMIDGIDHLVLTVRDIAVAVDFYSRILGMEPITFGDKRTALRFGRQKINLHQAGHEFEPKAKQPTPGSADICFLSSVSVEEIARRWRAAGVEVIEGPVMRTGAVGPIRSVYCRDPDGNLIEVSNQEKSPIAEGSAD
jgi:catechol 2,3-dioxygenase-like lactoylglutathione lyase family enzyme